MTRHGELAQLAAAQAFTAWLKLDAEVRPGGDRELDISYESARVYRSQVEALLAAVRTLATITSERANRLAEENDHLKAWLCVCPGGNPADFNPDAECAVHGDPTRLHPRMRDALKWRDAFERLHARVVGVRDFDVAECAPPEQEGWRDELDRLTTFAAQLHEDLVKRGLL